MLNHISSIEQLEKEAGEIQDYLEITCSEDPEECIARGNDLVVYMARSGKMLADAKYHKDQALANSIIRSLGEQAGAPATVLNKLVDAACKRENLLVNKIERIHRTCIHQVDWLRTVVSKAKEERRVGSGVSGQPSRDSRAQDSDYAPF